MKRVLNIVGRLLMMTLTAAIVLRPVVVLANSSFISTVTAFSAQSQPAGSPTFKLPVFPKNLASGILLRTIAKETSNMEGLIPRISKSKAPSTSESRFSFVSVAQSFSPRNFLVLRI